MDGRLAQMEVVLNEYKSTVTKLEDELENLRGSNENSNPSPGRTSAQVEELIVRAKEVQDRNEELEKGQLIETAL